ncbi:transmembrane component of general energizing module of ECF transporters [Desulfocucumis palustris]|uniref:Transmembrane component of general energizing module of ECF transporters n=1 Tax=Desulfocucumis palustris TaxID=1898651 RepID=A0A2L2XDL9_9FIRM|nr:energy-coupling factor transporter transmembrane component T [Desulfocucumis palustris]GBF31921.1 transmembrane component of general energizing module of ECF transporters [Desulfocucumis palustris]
MFDGLMVGQYIPANSPVHRLDPRTKILSMLLLITAAALAKGTGFLPVAAVSVFALLLSRVPFLFLWRGFKALWVILFITFILQIFFTPGETIYTAGPLTITKEGLLLGGQMLLRLVLLILISSLLTMTTTPVGLTAGIEHLGRPLQRFGVPVHEMAMMMTIALRFVPTLLQEAFTVSRAQQSRGAGLSGVTLERKFTALVSLMVPVFAGAFRRAEELSTAMETRCYHGGAGRTKMKLLTYHPGDYMALAVSLAVPLAVLALRLSGSNGG